MIIPSSGRVVIVDDKIQEISTLMDALSQSGIGFTYFNGAVDKLPPKPLDGITYMFLDLELDEALIDDKTKASQDIMVVNKILGDNSFNQSVVIIVWSGALTILSHLRTMMQEAKISPLALLEVNKLDCKDPETGNFVFEKVVNKIDEKLIQIPALNLLSAWDNMVNCASYNVSKLIFPKDQMPQDRLNKYLNGIYNQLAIANLGKKNVDKDQAFAVVNTLNSILANEISKVTKSNQSPMELDLQNIAILQLSDLGKLNAGINIECCSGNYQPGSLFENVFTENKVTGFDIFVNKDTVKRNYNSQYAKMVSVCCEVTPLCDFAQKRLVYHRLITGLIVPAPLASYTKNNADYLYRTPIFCIDNILEGEPFFLIFDLRHFFTISVDGLQNKTPLFRLGDSITMHIQNRLGRQVSNPGITFIDNNSGE